jgi:ketopantoate reductase
MKICVFGAGAIGSYLAVELSLAGHDVCVIARGEHLSAIVSKGLTLRIAETEKIAKVSASDDPSRFGPQDYLFCTLKAHQAHTAAPSMVPLLGLDTAVVTAMNGIPWWYFYKEGSSFEGTRTSGKLRRAGERGIPHHKRVAPLPNPSKVAAYSADHRDGERPSSANRAIHSRRPRCTASIGR